MKPIILLLIPTLILASQYVPLKPYTPGISTGAKGADLQIEIIYDPMCGDSANFDQTWQQVQMAISIDPSLKQKVSIRYILLALPYHITAHKLTLALMYIRKVKGGDTAMSALRYFFENRSQFDQTSLGDNSINDYLRNVARTLSNRYNLGQSELFAAMARNSQYDTISRYQQKFVLGILGHCGAPRALLNWNQIDGCDDFSVNEWISFLTKNV